jgi:cobalt-zinc-cadmium efflux system outer membrane protein
MAALAIAWSGVLAAAPAMGETPSHVAPARPPAPIAISLGEALHLGATAGREVAVARAPRAAVADAKRAAEAVITSPPRATVQVGDRRGPWGSGVEVGVTVMADIPLGGPGAARRGVADALGKVVEADVERAKIDAATRAGLAWVTLAEADRVLALRQKSLAQASAVAKAVAARVSTGVVDPLELALARGDEATARAAVLAAEGSRFEAAMELAFAIGAAPGTAVEIKGGLDDAAVDGGDEAALLKRAESHPLVELAKARQGAAQREADLAAAAQIPGIGVGASYTREGGGDHVILGVVSVPLPFSMPWRFDVARQRAAADAAAAQASLSRAELGREIRAALHEREHTREVYEALSQGALGPMREALRLSEAQLAAGALDVTRVLGARQRLLATEELIVKSLADVRRADLRLARAAGTLPRGEGAR